MIARRGILGRIPFLRTLHASVFAPLAGARALFREGMIRPGGRFDGAPGRLAEVKTQVI